MNEKFKTWFGISLAGLFVLIAGNGIGFIESARAIPSLVSAWASEMPMGVWSVFVAWLVGMVVYLLAEHRLPDSLRSKRAAETISILVTIGVALSQTWIGGGSPAQRLSALWLGIIAGYLAPYVARRLQSVYISATKTKPGGR